MGTQEPPSSVGGRDRDPRQRQRPRQRPMGGEGGGEQREGAGVRIKGLQGVEPTTSTYV